MNIYKEIKDIAKANAKIERLANLLAEKIYCDGLNFAEAYFVSGCREKNGHLYHGEARLDNSGLVDDDYYCDQYTGYLGDDFYGTLYYKTDVRGVFVAIPFDM